MNEGYDSLFVELQQALAGRYSLERELGRGGMGVVYLAREVRLDRLVAIKVLPPHLAAHAPLRERFAREARTAAGLSHPNIIPIHAVDETGGLVFYVMTYIAGGTLADQVAKRGPLPASDAARILREVAWTLAYAHAQGVIHRDVKPENILIEEASGRAMVTDFGIARVTQAGGGTGVGEVLGTPDFMSPEQASGEAVDGRTDLYSLGAVGFYLLTGRAPFDGDNATSILAQHLTQPAPPVATVAPSTPRALAQAIDRCLAKPVDERFASGEALAEALSDALDVRRDIPVPVRVFLRQIDRDLGPLFLIAAIVSFLVLPNILGAAFRWSTGIGVLLAVLGYAVILVAVSLLPYAIRARKLLRAGYDADDVALAVRNDVARHQEELAYEHGPKRGRLERFGWMFGVGLLAVAVGVSSLGTFTWNPGPGPFQTPIWIRVELFVVCASFVAGGALLAFSIRRKFERGSIHQAFWSRVGPWIFKVARIGLKLSGFAATNRPTELALGSAADALFEALPKEIRRALRDLPDVLRRLEDKAQQIRGQVDQLDRLRGEARGVVRPGLRVEHRSSVLADLDGARAAAQSRLGQVVAAMEAIRLDLLRLRAGAGSLESVTADLTAAREIGEQTDRLLAAHAEVNTVLKG